MTKSELEKKVAGLELAIKSITERTGCPKGFLPKRKMAKRLNVSVGMIEFAATSNPRMSKRVYSTKTGGQIINCTGYNINSMRKALAKVRKDSSKVGDKTIEHNTGVRFRIK